MWPANNRPKSYLASTKPISFSPVKRNNGSLPRESVFRNRQSKNCWCLYRGGPTSSLSEQSRQAPQGQWYCPLAGGRVGRRQLNLLKLILNKGGLFLCLEGWHLASLRWRFGFCCLHGQFLHEVLCLPCGGLEVLCGSGSPSTRKWFTFRKEVFWFYTVAVCLLNGRANANRSHNPNPFLHGLLPSPYILFGI